MAPSQRLRTGLYIRLLLTSIVCIVLVMLATADKGKSAMFAAANRCTPVTTASSAAYHCWSAYPEAFYAAGYTSGRYQLSWKVSCSGQSVSGGKNVHGLFKVIVDQFTSQPAYRLMISSDVCKIDVVATKTAGSGSITMELFINQNHPLPVHN